MGLDINTKKMTATRKVFSIAIMLPAFIFMIACSSSKDNSTPIPPRSTTYTLKVKDVLGVTGTVTFIETSSTVTTVTISLSGAPVGLHPADICQNSAIEGGPVVVTLNPVDETGKSSTQVTSMNYTQLITYNGFVKVTKSSSEQNIIVAQGDIGGNVITTISKTYKLDTVKTYGVSGTALFEKRVNGSTLLTISLTGVIPGNVFPSTINLGSVTTIGGGPVTKTLNNIDGTTGKGYTNIRALDNGLTITYDNWLVYDGYINVYLTSVSLNNIISHGNIGTH